jgi:hypothetical protein
MLAALFYPDQVLGAKVTGSNIHCDAEVKVLET